MPDHLQKPKRKNDEQHRQDSRQDLAFKTYERGAFGAEFDVEHQRHHVDPAEGTGDHRHRRHDKRGRHDQKHRQAGIAEIAPAAQRQRRDQRQCRHDPRFVRAQSRQGRHR
ncbi:MAG: hypothetical protein R3D84_15450 [Paracoccaceae bacterium]